MKTKALHIIPFSIQLFLLIFWLYVGLEKLWNLPGFHTALLKQPFPDSWADHMYWSLPIIELGIGLLLVSVKTVRLGFRFSALLLLVFSLYIALGVAGLYPERPCGCASIFHTWSWEQHLAANLVLFSLSILGWYLTGPTAPIDNRKIRYKQSIQLFRAFMLLLAVEVYMVIIVMPRRFPRRFALFPATPVCLNLIIR